MAAAFLLGPSLLIAACSSSGSSGTSTSSAPGGGSSLTAAAGCGSSTEKGAHWPSRACTVPRSQQEYVWIAANVGDPFYADGKAGFYAAAKAWGVKASLIGPLTADVSQQVSMIDQAIANPNTMGILFYALDYKAEAGELQKARAAGITVIDGNGDYTDPSVRDAFVGTANSALGSRAADLVGQVLNGHGTVGVVTQITALNHQQRLAGFKQELAAKYPGITVAGVANEDGSATVEAQAAGSLLSAHPGINLLWTSDAGGGVVATVLKERGLTGKVLAVGTDRSPAEIDAICSGTVHATIAQDTYSEEFTALNYMAWLANKLSTVPDSTITAPSVITKANASC